MAKAKSFTRKITRSVTEEVPGYVELNLTPEEAKYLHSLIGGHVVGRGPLRVLSTGIFKALDDHVKGTTMINTCVVIDVSGGYK